MENSKREFYKEIPGLKRKASVLVYGCATKGFLMGKDQSELLDQILASGINIFDLARGYGKAESAVGKWMKARKNREEVILISKCGNVSLFGRVHINEKTIEKELNRSLKELQSDYIDIYLLHRDDPKTPVKIYIDTLNRLKKEGKIRLFGVSNWTAERIKEANDYASANGLEGFSVSSPQFSLAVQEKDPWGGNCVAVSPCQDAFDRKYYLQTQLPLFAYSSLARGFFSGRFQSNDYAGAKKILDFQAKKAYLSERNMIRLKQAEELAKEKETNVSSIALSYVLSSEMNTFAIVSTTNVKRLTENIKASEMILSIEERKRLEGND